MDLTVLDYNSIMYTMSDNPYPQDIIIAKLFRFQQTKIVNAIEYQNQKLEFCDYGNN
jgi:hypothetical protein